MVRSQMSVIFISHKLKEVMEISDRVVVLRSGKVVFEHSTAESSRQELARRMVGRDLPEPTRTRVTAGEPVVELRDVQVVEDGISLLSDVSLKVCRSEVLGVVGVSGNGQQVLFQLLAGLVQPSSGSLRMFGQPVTGLSPAELVQLGVGRIPEDRHTTGLVPDLPIWENLIAETYRRPAFQQAGFLRRKKAFEFARAIIKEYDVRCPSPSAVTRLLSGGNMQKLILGRNLSRRPEVILANQPTRGLDIGAVSFVHNRLSDAKAAGAGVLLISEDLDELLALLDRLVVMFAGRVSQPLLRDEVSIEQLGLMMMGQATELAA
jgi:general nucleoside transport system ATP-binding protein